MKITASISSVKRKENDEKDVFFRIKDYDENKSFNCAYGGFMPLREKDNIKGEIEIINKVWWFKDLPLVVIPKHRDRIYDACFKALRGKGAHQQKVNSFIDELEKEYDDIDSIYDFLSTASCDEKVELVVESFTFEQIAVFLRWWKKNMVLRQLYLWQLYDSEIKKSNYYPSELINILQKNAFLVPNLELEKACMIERLFGKNVDEAKLKKAQIYKQVLSCQIRGWCAMPLGYLLRMFPELPLYKQSLCQDFGLIFESDLVYSKDNYEIEEFLSDKISEWITRSNEAKINNSIKLDYQISDKIKLTKEQDNALSSILQNHISVVTGGAGCGKTTLIRQLVHNLRLRGESFILTSFTGKAVLRIKETLPDYCQNICYTMSRLIHKKNTKQKIPDFAHLIIDEASMISHELIYQFLNIFPHYYKIYFFGDCNQLPPVGSGNFLQQLIISEQVNTNYLTINKRIISERKDSFILDNANFLIDNKRLLTDKFAFKNGPGFYALEGDIKYCQQLLKGLAKKGIKDSEITVLTPFNKDIAPLISCHQRSFLGDKYYNYENIHYFIGDRVMQTKNIYQEDLEIMNGEEGIITEVDEEGILVSFNVNKKIKYKWHTSRDDTFEDDEEDSYESEIKTNYLKHSFCKTVHKAQGSEYEYVIIFLPKCNNSLVNINLIYTAITRAKKMIWLIGDLEGLQTACNRQIPASYDRLAIKINDKT